MNKKGWGLDFFSLFIILFVVVVMLAIIHSPDEITKQRQINAAYNSLNWSKYSSQFSILTDDGNISTYVRNIVYTFVNAIGYIIMEVAKISLQFALKNPQFNWILIIWLIFFSILAPTLMFIIRLIVLICILVSELIIKNKEAKKS